MYATGPCYCDVKNWEKPASGCQPANIIADDADTFAALPNRVDYLRISTLLVWRRGGVPRSGGLLVELVARTISNRRCPGSLVTHSVILLYSGYHEVIRGKKLKI